MFAHEGPARQARANGILAGYLALTAGFVNAGGFVLLGSFTSHVTGSVGRFGNDLAMGDYAAALFAALLVFSFFIGASVASLILEAGVFSRRPLAYATALFLEGALLAAFIFVTGLSQTTKARLLDSEAAILCCAMGMQNSLVTQLSGAVIRTTHLTGVVTDLGIEAARWLRWARAPIRDGDRPKERPSPARAILLSTLAVAFTLGAASGAMLTLWVSRWAMLLPAGAVGAAGAYALRIAKPRQSFAQGAPPPM